nr:polymer-forming cytoskeletal protein [Acidisoma cellulosilyticum]
MPPFRPAPPKEKDLPNMARPPFAPSSSTVPTMPPAPGAMRPGMPPQTRTPGLPESSERRTLVVGRGISVQGTINDAERLVVEGKVEATLIHAAELSVIDGGIFKGEIEVEEAEIAGIIDGVVTARTSLIVRATGRVLGKARCRRLQVEDGGQITGQIEMLNDAPPAASPAPSPVVTTGLQTPGEIGRPDVPASEV